MDMTGWPPIEAAGNSRSRSSRPGGYRRQAGAGNAFARVTTTSDFSSFRVDSQGTVKVMAGASGAANQVQAISGFTVCLALVSVVLALAKSGSSG